VDMTKSFGADTILIYLVSVFFFLFPFVSFHFFLILDCAADSRSIFRPPGSRFRSIASPHPITGIPLAEAGNISSAFQYVLPLFLSKAVSSASVVYIVGFSSKT